jgi:hypothetical protein
MQSDVRNLHEHFLGCALLQHAELSDMQESLPTQWYAALKKNAHHRDAIPSGHCSELCVVPGIHWLYQPDDFPITPEQQKLKQAVPVGTFPLLFLCDNYSAPNLLCSEPPADHSSYPDSAAVASCWLVPCRAIILTLQILML